MRSTSLRALVPAVALALVVIPSALGATAPKRKARPPVAPRPITLATSPTPIVAFAQDAHRIAWASSEPGTDCPSRIRARNLVTNAQVVLTRVGGPTCTDPLTFGGAARVVLALAGDRIAWATRTVGTETVERIRVASIETREDVDVEQLVFATSSLAGAHLGGLAGNGTTLVYGRYEQSLIGDVNCEDAGTCKRPATVGSTRRIGGAKLSDVGATGPTALVAVGGGHVVSVAPDVAGVADAESTDRGVVEVWDASIGALACSFSPSGTVLAVASERRYVALLAETAGKRFLERYDPRSCAAQGSSQVSGDTAPELSASDSRILLRIGETLVVIDLASGKKTAVATVAGGPLGATIEGRRVAWAEARGGGGRIRAVTLAAPRR